LVKCMFTSHKLRRHLSRISVAVIRNRPEEMSEPGRLLVGRRFDDWI